MAKSTIVLIHGSWHWGGCFQKVADRLAVSGYPTLTPDLTSHGYSEAAWTDVDSMETYTMPVRKLLADMDEPVVLVGHSMGGVSLTYLAETMPEKIRSLVYLTAFMTPPDKTANDYLFSYSKDPLASALFQVVAPVDGGGLALDVEKPELVREAFYGDCSEVDLRVAKRNAVPINSAIPNVYTPRSITGIERHYITCSNDRAIPLSVQWQMIQDVPGCTVHAIGTSHSPFFSAPDQLATVLRTIAGGD